MRVVTRLEDVEEQFERAHSEAVKAFGNGSIFIEKFVQNPRYYSQKTTKQHQVDANNLSDQFADTLKSR